MRRFKLINAEGAEWDLNDPSAFFQNPDGLGLERDIQSIAAGDYWIEIDDEPTQKKPNGEMVFKTYELYAEFVQFCAKSPLVLGYAPMSTWHYLDCKLQRLGKSEKDRTMRRLVCPVDFVGFGLWYDKIDYYTVQTSSAVGKTYPYTYPYTYLNVAAGSVEIVNNGDKLSPCKLHIFGDVVNPSWALIVGGEITAEGKVDATIAAGSKLVIDSMPSVMEIAEYTSENVFVQNQYQNSEFDTARFILAPVGTSLLSFIHEGAGELTAAVEVKKIADTI